MTSWQELVETGGPVMADGAMGTMLMANGLEFGDPPEVWNLEHPEIIRRVQRAYADAGAQILLTNTFGGNRLRLELHGREDRVDQLNRTAAVRFSWSTRSSRPCSSRRSRLPPNVFVSRTRAPASA